MAVLITGTPGTGKTTVSRILSLWTGRPHINLAEFVKRNRLYLGYDEESMSYIVDEDAVRKTLRDVLTCSEIVDTHVVTALPPERIRVAVVLRLDPLVLKERLVARGYPPSKVRGNVEAEILGIVASDAVRHLGREKVHEIDVTSLSPEDAARIVEKIMSGVEKRPLGAVDWLEKYWSLLEHG